MQYQAALQACDRLGSGTTRKGEAVEDRPATPPPAYPHGKQRELSAQATDFVPGRHQHRLRLAGAG
eukprot:701782-Alexandrium_andersonii.AAC.1